ncbi:hypothetical protein TRVA0_062S00496 [Trichomonascus vanleenenianus]|uniref:uncharacterized protein n=1 Tax=Trichomonascus vanleenenianus TaxID=2268995 RepID=UPI003ECAB93C
MKQKAVSLLQSFGKNLLKEPKLKIESPKPHRRPTGSTAPILLANEIKRILVSEDQRMFESVAETHIPKSWLNRLTTQSHGFMPLWENHRLRTKADVAQLSRFQLVHPVQLGLNAIAPEGLEVVASAAQRTQHSSRLGLLWELRSKSDDKLLKNLGAMEFQNTGTICKSDFEAIMVREADNKESGIGSSVSWTLLMENSGLKNNAIPIIRQVGKYAQDCENIVVFDWDAMLLFDFGSVPLDGTLRVNYFEESEEEELRGMTYRRLLFAFLARALSEYARENGLELRNLDSLSIALR